MTFFGARKPTLPRERRKIVHSQRPEKEEPDVIISSLGSDTLRWIKERRAKGSEVKVAVTTGDEQQLREIFESFDFDRSGNVSLLEFEAALRWIRENRHFKKLTKELDHLERTFIAMDADGDATVDYQEFTIGMTGSANGALDGLTPTDLNKLLSKFVEYAMMKKRERALYSITNLSPEESDLIRFQLFNKVFTLHGETELEEPEIDTNLVPIKERGAYISSIDDSQDDDGTVIENDSITTSKSNNIFTPDPSQTSINQGSIDTTSLDGLKYNLYTNSTEYIDPEAVELRQRLDDEWAAVEASKNLRFEILKLPEIKKRSKISSSIKPAPLREGKALQLRQTVASEAYGILRTSASAPSLFHNPTLTRLSIPKNKSRMTLSTMLPSKTRKRSKIMF